MSTQFCVIILKNVVDSHSIKRRVIENHMGITFLVFPTAESDTAGPSSEPALNQRPRKWTFWPQK